MALWLWFTVLFANFAEALAEGRSKAQAASLRSLKKEHLGQETEGACNNVFHGTTWLPEQAENLRKGDVVLVEAGDMVPLDGEVIEGVASVDESAITGESAPVVRESGGDFSSVTGGTRVLVRLAGGAHHGQSGRVLSGPHDQHGRGRQSARRRPTKSR